VKLRMRPPISPAVMWHDVECGTYAADLPLWEELAAAAPGPVLDVGAGTGRVALHLARAGRTVTALDLDPVLLGALAERAWKANVEVETVVADAAGFDVGRGRFGLVAVPMQTLQLLPGAAGRAGFWASARAALVPGGLVAAAISTDLEPFDSALGLPAPDVGRVGGWRFVSQPVAICADGDGMRIDRIRHLVAPGGGGTATEDSVRLTAVTPGGLAEEAAAHGLEAVELRRVPETEEHVGSDVVVLRA
jgi:SAM-dependent methyltransferase